MAVFPHHVKDGHALCLGPAHLALFCLPAEFEGDEALGQHGQIADVRLLLCLCEKHEWDSRRELADFAGISRTNLTSGLQRLTMKGFLKIEEVKEPKPSRKSKAAGEVQGKAEKPETRRKDRKTKVTVTILPTAEAVMKELALAQRDYDEARFVGFTEEELIKYADLSEKIKENTKRILG